MFKSINTYSPEPNSSGDFCSYCDGEGFTFTEEEITVFLADGTAPLYKLGIFGSGQYPLVQWGESDPSTATGFTSWFYFENYERYTIREQKRFIPGVDRCWLVPRPELAAGNAKAHGRASRRWRGLVRRVAMVWIRGFGDSQTRLPAGDVLVDRVELVCRVQEITAVD
jgi:hypothetical protein